MDPLSITASIVAVIQIAGTLSGYLGKLSLVRGLQEIVQSLTEDITELQEIMRQIDILCSNDAVNSALQSTRLQLKFSQPLRSAEAKLIEAEFFLKAKLANLTSPEARFKVAVLKKGDKERLLALRGQLRIICQNLSFLLSTVNTGGVLRLGTRIEDVATTVTDIQTTQKVLVADNMRLCNSVSQQVSKTLATISDSHSMQMNTLLRDIRAGFSDVRSTLSREDPESLSCSETLSNENSQALMASSGMLQKPPTRISQMNSATCESWCDCRCHSRHRLQSPDLIKYIFGSIYLGYMGFPFLMPSCNEADCKRQFISSMYIYYKFPIWLISRIITLFILVKPPSDVFVTIKLPRVVGDDAPFFQYAIAGNVEGMRDLLSRRIASPTDIDADSGYSALHYAVDFGHTEAVKLLLNEAADPLIPTYGGTCARDIAWVKILSNTFSKPTQDIFRVLFADEDVFEDLGLSLLHRLILDLSPGSLKDELRKDSSQVNIKDTAGRTPLAWSCFRGDEDTTLVLLAYQSDPNIVANTGDSPLHFAVMASYPVCITPLLKAGASITHRNTWQETAFHLAAEYQDDAAYLEPLLRAGIDVNIRGFRGQSAFIGAAQTNHVNAASFLINNGADINLKSTVHGYTALAVAVQYNSHDVLELLLQHRPDVDIVFPDGDTILHRGARAGDLKTLDLLHGIKFETITGGEANGEGLTALDELQRRSDFSKELLEAFYRLLPFAESEESEV